eukprot:355908-Chlamydomonas_euryale.AAC.2
MLAPNTHTRTPLFPTRLPFTTYVRGRCEQCQRSCSSTMAPSWRASGCATSARWEAARSWCVHARRGCGVWGVGLVWTAVSQFTRVHLGSSKVGRGSIGLLCGGGLHGVRTKASALAESGLHVVAPSSSVVTLPPGG